MMTNGKYKTITLPKLNGLSPTIESTMIKLSEEAGELAREVGKFRNMSGEKNIHNANINQKICEELIDVAQVAVTFLFVMESHGVDVNNAIEKHIMKMKEKGYLI